MYLNIWTSNRLCSCYLAAQPSLPFLPTLPPTFTNLLPWQVSTHQYSQKTDLGRNACHGELLTHHQCHRWHPGLQNARVSVCESVCVCVSTQLEMLVVGGDSERQGGKAACCENILSTQIARKPPSPPLSAIEDILRLWSHLWGCPWSFPHSSVRYQATTWGQALG